MTDTPPTSPDPEENLPSINIPATVFPTVNSDLSEVRPQDLVAANASIAGVMASWNSVRSIAGVCRLVDATFKAIEGRRKVLGLPYGSPPETTRKPDIVYPLD